jgi:hypothetical protein
MRTSVMKRLAAAAGWTVRAGRAAPGLTVRAIGAGWTLGAQFTGAGSALAGLYLLAGVAVTLVVGGVALLAVGTLAEMAGPAGKVGR